MQLEKRQNQNMKICLTPGLCSIHQTLEPHPTNPYSMMKDAKIKEQGGNVPTVTQVTSGRLRLDPGPLAFLSQSSVCSLTFLLPHPLIRSLLQSYTAISPAAHRPPNNSDHMS